MHKFDADQTALALRPRRTPGPPQGSAITSTTYETINYEYSGSEPRSTGNRPRHPDLGLAARRRIAYAARRGTAASAKYIAIIMADIPTTPGQKGNQHRTNTNVDS